MKKALGLFLAATLSLVGNTVLGGGHGEANSFGFALVVPAKEVSRVDASKGITGNLIYILSEHYETPEGLGKRLAVGDQWKDIGEMQEIMGKYGIAVVMGEKISSMNR